MTLLGLLLLLIACGGVDAPADVPTDVPPVQKGAFVLELITSDEKIALEGATVSETIRVSAFSQETLRDLAFYLNDLETQTLQTLGNTATVELDTTLLANGEQTLTAVAQGQKGERKARATFTVSNESTEDPNPSDAPPPGGFPDPDDNPPTDQPTETPPVDEAPESEAPVETSEPTTDEAPIEETSTEETSEQPTTEVPTEEAPAEETSEETPAETPAEKSEPTTDMPSEDAPAVGETPAEKAPEQPTKDEAPTQEPSADEPDEEAPGTDEPATPPAEEQPSPPANEAKDETPPANDETPSASAPPATTPPSRQVNQMPDLSRDAMLTHGPIAFPEDFMVSVRDYGAVGNGVTDDTAAIQKALDDGRTQDKNYFGYPKALYFPAGVYLVSDTLEWRGCCVTLQGQGSGVSVIKLKNGTAGFGNPSSPKPVIKTPDGNESFRQNIWDLAVSTGSGNAGAVGIDYIVNNVGSLRNVLIRSGDGKGVRGLDLTRKWPGPLLIKGLAVDGFDVGIHVDHTEYGPTFEYVWLENQRVAGILNEGNTLAIRGLKSRNRVPAVRSTEDRGMVVLIDSELENGASTANAIENKGFLYARNVRTSGYGAALEDRGTTVEGPLTDYLSHASQSLFDDAAKTHSLNLLIEETPEFHDEVLDNWAAFEPKWYGDTEGLQELFDSGKSTIYFPAGRYMSYRETTIVVPPTVKKIVGFSSVINENSSDRGSGGIRFVVSANSPDPLIIEGFGYGAKVTHASKRTVVLKSGTYRYYDSKPGAGDLFLEDVFTYKIHIQKSQNVWARQYNNEVKGTKVINDGGKLWLLGLKTEHAGTVIETRNGGQTELLGTLIYPAFTVPADDVAFVIEDSQASLIYATTVYNEGKGYVVHVEETRDGETRTLLEDSLTKNRMPLFVGY